MDEKIKAIYYIKDNRNDRIIYIGQTKNFKQREKEHFRKNICPIDLYMFNEGRENFSMEIFEDIDVNDYTDEDLRKKEDELILQYDTINNGLNKVRSGLVTKNKEYYNIILKNWRNNNKEYVNEQAREYWRNNEKYREYRKQYKHSEKYKEYMRNYCQTEEYKERHRNNTRKYYARKKAEKTDIEEGL